MANDNNGLDMNALASLEVFTLAQAMAFAQLKGEAGITRALRRGLLRGGKNGGNAGGWRITKRALLAWIDEGMPGSEAETETDNNEQAATKGGEETKS